ncbi:trehalose-6-phosphate synthase [Tistrella bauzanensis]|uniref:Trehalose-6-phosphate synthase n=1 Tax=Tistrella bauzanensis TaxID=657419 RepID=A0ABQ1I8H1_9PROT|nr:trehalose-6-phosphate synthase [Tistrella bauzanensis]GGB27355.1 trehalose-6-phosphate synthase [Tistrella bauzanensis]
MKRIVVISNRVARAEPQSRDDAGATGGLAVAVREALSETAGLWFGWSGALSETPAVQPPEPQPGGYRVATMDLTPADHRGYYNGYANEALWPVLHSAPHLMHHSAQRFSTYQSVNIQFVERLMPFLHPDDMIWIHDYHLMPAAQELRRRGLRNPIGFFLHTPFPAAETFAALPEHRRLIEGLCHADLIGFQTGTDLRAFHDYIRYEAQGTVSMDGRVDAFGRQCRASVFPISIDPMAFAKAAEAHAGSDYCRQLQNGLAGRSLVLGVDRLDYTKGLPHRMLAYECLLERHPELHRTMSFLQIASQSRSKLPEYVAIRRELEEVSGRINGRFSEPDWLPLRYINRGIPRETLAGVLRMARMALVTPLHDGMNLVAKEYVAAQDPEDPGVLMLSRFAGAAQELETALIVNPLDHAQTADKLHQGLTMSLSERRERWQAMMAVISTNDVGRWWRSFVRALADAANPTVHPPAGRLSRRDFPRLPGEDAPAKVELRHGDGSAAPSFGTMALRAMGDA